MVTSIALQGAGVRNPRVMTLYGVYYGHLLIFVVVIVVRFMIQCKQNHNDDRRTLVIDPELVAVHDETDANPSKDEKMLWSCAYTSKLESGFQVYTM